MKSYPHIKSFSPRIIVSCIAVMLSCSLYAAQKPVSESLQGTFSGDYIIYRDYSWKSPTWIGFLYYDDETYGAFLCTPEKSSTVSILFSVKPESGTLVLTGQKIISAITPTDTLAVNYLMTVLPKLYELRTFPDKRTGVFGTLKKDAEIEEFGGTVSLQYDSYLPIFHIKTVSNAKKALVLELSETGSIRQTGDEAFYHYVPIEPVSTVNRFKRNKAAKAETVTVNGIDLHLDSQWKKIADNSFLCGDTAFLTVTTVCLPPKLNNALTAQEQFIRLLVSSSPAVKILMPYTVIEGSESLFTVTQSIYDRELKKITKDIKRCIKKDDGCFIVISLTVDTHAYTAEKNYFDRLF